MAGPILVVLALLVVIPVGVIITGGVIAAVISTFVRLDVAASNEGSELLELNG